MSAKLKDAAQEQARTHLRKWYHGGDALAAVQTLLDDCRHLRRELVLTEGAMSHGMTRGWKPSYDR